MTPFAWHRLVLPLPDRWSPIKLGGNANKGSVEFVDLHRPRLGMRWQRLAREPADVEAMLRGVLRAEAGALAAGEARPPAELPQGALAALMYLDVPPYRRDIAVAYFRSSRRVVQLSCPIRRRESTLGQELLPGLTESPPDAAAPWAVLGLTCVTPPEYSLERHRLNAGDLALFFSIRSRLGTRRAWASVRQIAVASLALQRSTLLGWMRTMQKPDAQFYRGPPELTQTTLTLPGGEMPAGLLRMVRRRRFFYLRFLPPGCVTLGCHDADRDRIVLLHGTDEDVLRQMAVTVGVSIGAPETR